MLSALGRIMLATITLTICASVTMAQFPTTANVQGRWTDSTGEPVYTNKGAFAFSIWNDSTAGDRVWPKGGISEDHAVSTNVDGLWNVALGTTYPLSADVFHNALAWLQVVVQDGDDPAETLPRIELMAVPYAYRAQSSGRADSAAVAGDAGTLDGLSSGDFAANNHNHDAAYVNTAGDAMTGPLQVPFVSVVTLDIGDATADGELNLKQAGDGSDVVHAYMTPSLGGAVDLYDEAGNITFMAQPDYEGRGGLLKVSGGGGGLYGFIVDGEQSPTDTSVFVWMLGTKSNCQFNTNRTGNASVVLPTGAISSTELLNEPGISHAVDKDTWLELPPDTTMIDVVTTQITVPAAGYIVVEASGTAWRQIASAGDLSLIFYQIDETAGGGYDPNYYQTIGTVNAIGGESVLQALHCERVFYKAAAGTYYFRLEATGAWASAGGYRRIMNSSIRATYYPTSYGTVATVVSQDKAAQFESAELMPRPIATPDGRVAQEPGYVVDLRELELKAAQEKAEYEQAQRELLEARLAEQMKRAAAGGGELR